jgi:hypothetical protein
MSCIKCSITKTISEMKDKYICKECHNKEERERYKKRKELILEEIKNKGDENVYIKCVKCKENKSSNNFNKTFKYCNICSKTNKKVIKKINKFDKKICKKCNVEKDVFDYFKSSTYCKDCSKNINKKYYENNKKQIIESVKKYKQNRIDNNIFVNEILRKCKNCNIEKEINLFSKGSGNFIDTICKNCKNENAKEYRKNSKDKRKEYINKNKILIHLRNLLKKRIKTNIIVSRNLLIGIENNIFKNWLLFCCNKLNYKNENYGIDWHVDHIIPCKRFNLELLYNQEICFHWTNLIPLKKELNITKKDKIILEQIDYSKKLLEEFILLNNLSLEIEMKYWNKEYLEIIKNTDKSKIKKTFNLNCASGLEIIC